MLSKVNQIARFWLSFSEDKMWTFSKDRVPSLYAMVLRSVATSSSVVSQLIRTQHKDVSVVCRTQIRVASAALPPGHKIFILAQRQRRLEVATHLTPATTCKYTLRAYIHHQQSVVDPTSPRVSQQL